MLNINYSDVLSILELIRPYLIARAWRSRTKGSSC